MHSREVNRKRSPRAKRRSRTRTSSGSTSGMVGSAAAPGPGSWSSRSTAVTRGSCDLTAYGKHWLRLFPQHGPGRKHHRPIALSAWQRDITHRHPEDLLRGLIQSDGCRVIASIRAPKGKHYSYARYYLSNRSADIRGIFCEHLDLLSIDWTHPMDYVIQIARRPAVEALDRFVGPKS